MKAWKSDWPIPYNSENVVLVLGGGRRTESAPAFPPASPPATPKKSAPPPASPPATPVKLEMERPATLISGVKDEMRHPTLILARGVAASAFSAPAAAPADCPEAAALADAAAPSLLNTSPHSPEDLAVEPPVREDIEMPSSGIAESVLFGPVSASAGALADGVTVPKLVYCSRASGSASIGMNSAPPADAAAATSSDSSTRQPENRLVNPASSSSSSSGDFGGTGVPAVPAAAGLFASRLATGCRTSKTGVSGVELSKSGQSRCQHCKLLIAKSVPRFLCWYSLVKPPGYIHTACIVGLTFSAAELRDNLSGLSPTEPILKEAIVDAMAALAARAF
jgi:hypothetical protein